MLLVTPTPPLPPGARRGSPGPGPRPRGGHQVHHAPRQPQHRRRGCGCGRGDGAPERGSWRPEGQAGGGQGAATGRRGSPGPSGPCLSYTVLNLWPHQRAVDALRGVPAAGGTAGSHKAAERLLEARRGFGRIPLWKASGRASAAAHCGRPRGGPRRLPTVEGLGEGRPLPANKQPGQGHRVEGEQVVEPFSRRWGYRP